MTSPRRFEGDLPALLAGLYVAGTPTYRDDLVQQIARSRQRPAWTFPGRWLPMEIVTTRVPTTRVPWRQIGVLALLALLLAAALAIYAGSQQVRVPAPFGPAGAGLVAFEASGDIHVVDPTTGNPITVVSGPELDLGPRYSRDGTRLVFERKVAGGRTELYVVRSDGSELTRITAEPLLLSRSLLGEPWEQYQFAPDGHSVLIASTSKGVGGITIARSDGSDTRQLDVGMAVTEPSYRPPAGAEILFVGQGPPGTGHGLYAVNAKTGDVRTIIEPSTVYDIAGANWSPDGSQIAYWRWGGPGEVDGINAHTRVISADGTGDAALAEPPGTAWTSGSDWSNDGTRLLVFRGFTPDYQDVRPAVVPVDGSSLGIETDRQVAIVEGCCPFVEWAPDDSSILVTPADALDRPAQQVIIDPMTGETRVAPWDTTSDPTWQRLAP
jgi:Tol biopolymer transport system component